MGLKFVGRGSVVVDYRIAQRNGMQWTLVNNCTGERMYCQTGVDAVERLRDECKSVQDYLDKLPKAGEPKKDDGYSIRVCYVGIDDAPAFQNLLDASDHVSELHAERNDLLSSGKHAIVRINYKSDRQLLFQEGDKVVFRDEEPATPAAPATPAHEGEGA